MKQYTPIKKDSPRGRTLTELSYLLNLVADSPNKGRRHFAAEKLSRIHRSDSPKQQAETHCCGEAITHTEEKYPGSLAWLHLRQRCPVLLAWFHFSEVARVIQHGFTCKQRCPGL